MLICLTLTNMAAAQETSVKPGINKNFEAPDLQVKQWVERFEREGRETFDKRQEILAACGIQPGMVVADIGAGSGLFTRLFAQKVGSDGHVFAVDIAKPFVEDIRNQMREAGLENVTGVVCTPADPNLEPASIDLAFICDTYHHFEFHYKTMMQLRRALRPGGQIVVVDFERIEGVSSDWILGHVRAGKEVVVKEIESCGFERVGEQDILEQSYFVSFRKATS
jgi:ubiquinone/menaquinone biosynthesis C-methylase UbiE